MNKTDIEKEMKGLLSDRFIELWWDLKLPGLGGKTPTQIYQDEPARLLEYAKGYVYTE